MLISSAVAMFNGVVFQGFHLADWSRETFPARWKMLPQSLSRLHRGRRQAYIWQQHWVFQRFPIFRGLV